MPYAREKQNEYNRAYYQANRERIRAQQAAYGAANRTHIVASRKGLTLAQFRALREAQGGRCAICADEMANPHIDHDHTCCPGSRSCGQCVRGLLCFACNHMIGKASDRPEVLEAGAAYLRRHAGGDR